MLRTVRCGLTLNSARDFEGPRRAKTALTKKNHVGDFAISNMARCGPAGRTGREDWARSESPETSPHPRPVGFCQEAESSQRRRMGSSTDGTGTPRHPHPRERGRTPRHPHRENGAAPPAHSASPTRKSRGRDIHGKPREDESSRPRSQRRVPGVMPKAEVSPGRRCAGPRRSSCAHRRPGPAAAPRRGRPGSGPAFLPARRGPRSPPAWGLAWPLRGNALLCAWPVTR